MQRFLLIVIIFLASVWLGIEIFKDPGLAFFSYRQWSVEMPLWFAGLSLILLLTVGYWVMQMANTIGFSWYRLKQWLRLRSKYKSYSKTNRGLLELAEGEWQQAENYLLKGVLQSEAPVINYLAAAEAAHAQGAYERGNIYLKKAQHVAPPQAELAIAYTEARLHFLNAEYGRVVTSLKPYYHLAPRSKAVLALLYQSYIRLADWQALREMLPALSKAKLLEQDELENLQKSVYRGLLLNSKSKEDVLVIWQSMPRKYQIDSSLLNCYLKKLLPDAQPTDALEVLIEKSLEKSWDNRLLHWYGLLPTTDSIKLLSRAESWLKLYPENSELLLTLGKLAIRCQFWGKAKSYLEASIKIKATKEALLQQGKLLESLGEVSTALQCYREGLLLANDEANGD